MSLNSANLVLEEMEAKQEAKKYGKDSYTPQFDFLLQYPGGDTLSSVYGKIWRYCQMKNGQCEASIQRLASELNRSTKTIARAIDWLAGNQYAGDHGQLGNGLITDLTPEYGNSRPHIYKINEDEHLRQTIAYNKFSSEDAPKIKLLGHFSGVKKGRKKKTVGQNV